jgi:glycine cleavage system H protein
MDIRYTADHEWVAVDGDVATVGITDHAQAALGELVFVQLPAVGASLAKGAAAAVVESVKAASDIYAPLTGTIIEVNSATVNEPAIVNTEPTGKGWLFKLKVSDRSELEQLLDESAYAKVTA